MRIKISSTAIVVFVSVMYVDEIVHAALEIRLSGGHKDVAVKICLLRV